MFSELFTKFHSFESHHQVLFALITAFGVICATWGIEKILEHFLGSKKLAGFVLSLFIGLGILWLTKYTIFEIM